jgi:hypothetical protein
LASVPDVYANPQNFRLEFLDLCGNFPDRLVDDELPDPYILVPCIATGVSQIP